MRISSGWLLVAAGISMFIALVCQNITIVGSYIGILLFALAAMIFADFCCAIIFIRGGRLRWAAVVLALPSLFIVWDFLRRAPYIF